MFMLILRRAHLGRKYTFFLQVAEKTHTRFHNTHAPRHLLVRKAQHTHAYTYRGLIGVSIARGEGKFALLQLAF